MVVLVFGLFTNIIVTLSLLLGGTAVLTGLVQVLSQCREKVPSYY
jgi:hypothetical protein